MWVHSPNLIDAPDLARFAPYILLLHAPMPTRKPRRLAPPLSGVPGTPGHPDYPPITAAQCKDLAFARRLVREMRSGHGGRRHQRDHLRRASRATHETEAFKHLYHGTYTDHEQRERDAHRTPRDRWIDSYIEPTPADPHHPGWWCDWTPARDRARAAQLQRELSAHPTRRRWQDCAIGDTVPSSAMPFSSAEAHALGSTVTLEWPAGPPEALCLTTRTFARYLHPLWLRVA